MVNTPVFVIHGAGNRSPDVLNERVLALQRRLGDRWELHPVFWGDLGNAADPASVDRIVPGYRERHEVRGTEGRLVDGDLDSLAVALAAGAPDEATSGGDFTRPDEAERIAMVAAGVRRVVRRDGRFGEDFVEEIVKAVAREWTGQPTWLAQVGDFALLDQVGAAVAADVLRALPEEEIVVRGEGVLRVVRASLSTLDNVTGAALVAAGDRVTRWAQRGLGTVFAQTLGDVLVYQRRQRVILDRVRATIQAVDGTLGTQDNPVRLVGHSLGATIAMDLATADPAGPLWTDAVVTFGSLWPVFHLCDPRGGGVGAYDGADGRRVELPTIRRWVNLYEPLDPFAFLAAPLFTLAGGAEPKDVKVRHSYPSGLGTHSVYWTAPQLVSEMAEAFRPSPTDTIS